MRRHLVSRVLPGFAIIGRAQFRSKRLRALATTYALTPSSVTLRLISGLILVAGQATYAFTSTAASLLRAKRLAAEATSYAFAVQDATLRRGKSLIAEASSIAFSVLDAGLRVSRRLVAGASTYTLSPTALTLRKGLNLVAGASSYAFTLTDAALRVSRKLVAAPSTYAITPTAATLRLSRTVVAATSTYALTAQSVTLTKSAYETPAYTNTGGTGDRTGIITVTTDLTISQGTINNLVDGSFSLNSTDSVLFNTQAWTGKYIRFDFGAPVLITAMRKHGQVGGYNWGTAIFRGSNDGSTWTTYGSAVTIVSDAGPTEYTELSTNTTGYRYYQIEGASGNATVDTWQVEWEFKIGNQV